MTDDRNDLPQNDAQGAEHGDAPGKGMPLIIKIFLPLCAVLLLLDFVVDREVHHSWENVFGFYAIYGFVACVLLVLSATQMRKVLMRNEDYYDAD